MKDDNHAAAPRAKPDTPQPDRWWPNNDPVGGAEQRARNKRWIEYVRAELAKAKGESQ